jgi:hypothetical protein
MYFMGDRDPWFDRMRARFRLEHGLMLGAAAVAVGVVTGAVILGIWINSGFGSLSEERLAILATTMVVIGLQTVFSSFLLSILGLRRQS